VRQRVDSITSKNDAKESALLTRGSRDATVRGSSKVVNIMITVDFSASIDPGLHEATEYAITSQVIRGRRSLWKDLRASPTYRAASDCM